MYVYIITVNHTDLCACVCMRVHACVCGCVSVCVSA